MTATIAGLELLDAETALAGLEGFTPGREYVVSCYLGLPPDLRTGNGYLADLRDAIILTRRTLSSHMLSENGWDAIDADLRRVVESLRDPRMLPHAPAVALFTCEQRDLFVVVPLSRPVRTRLFIDHVPRLRDIRIMQAGFGPLTVVTIDRRRARYFHVTGFGATELAGEVELPMYRGKFHSDRHSAPGVGEYHYHQRLAEERARHYATVREQLRTIEAEHRSRGVIVAGALREVAGLVPVLERAGLSVVGTARVNAEHITPAQVAAMAYDVWNDHELEREAAVVAAFVERVGEGMAVNGVQDTMKALAAGRVRTLLVRADTDVAEADEAIESAVAQDARIVIVQDPGNAAQVSNLGAELRYR